MTDAGEAVALVGDFNAYTQEDPLQLLYTAGYTDAAAHFAPGQYSYSFGGQSGSLDHVLLNAAALDRATGADIWEINAEESIALEYSRYNYHGTLFYGDDPYRSSDHDPVIVGLDDGLLGPIDLTFLNFNDFHGRIGNPPDTDTVRFAGTIEQQRALAAAAGGASVLLSAGDSIGASLFTSAQRSGQADPRRARRARAAGLGGRQPRVRPGLRRPRPTVSSPTSTSRTSGRTSTSTAPRTRRSQEYELIEVGGVTVGVIGVVTSETPSLVLPTGVEMLDFGDPVAAVNRVADELTDGNAANGEADIVVAEYPRGRRRTSRPRRRSSRRWPRTRSSRRSSTTPRRMST